MSTNSEQKKEYNKRYNEDHKEQIKQYNKQYSENNKENLERGGACRCKRRGNR